MLSHVNHETLHSIWPWVRACLEEMRSRMKSDWLPEDIYSALKNGQAALYTIAEDDGFCVLQRRVHCDGPVLFVWALYGRNKLAPLFDSVMAELAKLAKSVGAKKIVMHSPRKGWARRGFVAREIIYEREV